MKSGELYMGQKQAIWKLEKRENQSETLHKHWGYSV